MQGRPAARRGRSSRLHLCAAFVLTACGGAPTSTPPSGASTSGAEIAEAPSAPIDAATYERIDREARELAARPWDATEPTLPAELDELDYDAYRDIRFRPDRALFADSSRPFQVQLFHRGFYFRRPVDVELLSGGREERVAYSTSLFDFGRTPVPDGLDASTGFAGFRVHHPLNNAQYYDELIVFLGASYFRALGRDQVYGLSARGLAIDTATDRPEEFPAFTKFWIETPRESDRALVVYALLDSASTTGAYRFTIEPGDATRVHIDATLHPRTAMRKVGIAPLTSMFMFAETQRDARDYRPEVHDSDGLVLIDGNGEHLFRPLRNPSSVQVSAFTLSSPRAFGLVQRDRQFDHYEDLEALYHRRPSALIEPDGDWGAGHVELVEIPSDSETNDNVVAYWVSDSPLEAGGTYRFSYSLSWANAEPGDTAARVVATRQHRSNSDRVTRTGEGTTRFVLDFGGGPLQRVGGVEGLTATITATGGHASEPIIVPNPYDHTVRVIFDVRAEEGHPGPVELRAFLRDDDDVISETWSYPWHPNQ